MRADVPVEATAAELVDGVYFNAGQSCCARRAHLRPPRRVRRLRRGVRGGASPYVLGDLLDPATTLGPLVRTSAAAVREQIAGGRGGGGADRPGRAPADVVGTPYVAPQVLVGVDHRMRVMADETFGRSSGSWRSTTTTRRSS